MDGSICLSKQFLCPVFWGQAGGAVNAQQGWKGIATVLRDIKGTPSAPHPHSLEGQLQVIQAMGQPVSALPGLAGNARAVSLCLAIGMRAPRKEPDWPVPNFLFLFTEP